MNKVLMGICCVLLVGCCETNDADCTVQGLAYKRQAAGQIPEKVTQVGNVVLYRVVDYHEYVYFTVPCGDVHYNTGEMHGKIPAQVPHNVNGIGCSDESAASPRTMP